MVRKLLARSTDTTTPVANDIVPNRLLPVLPTARLAQPAWCTTIRREWGARSTTRVRWVWSLSLPVARFPPISLLSRESDIGVAAEAIMNHAG